MLLVESSFVKKLLKPVEYDPFEEDDEVSPEDFFFAFRHTVKHGEAVKHGEDDNYTIILQGTLE